MIMHEYTNNTIIHDSISEYDKSFLVITLHMNISLVM